MLYLQIALPFLGQLPLPALAVPVSSISVDNVRHEVDIEVEVDGGRATVFPGYNHMPVNETAILAALDEPRPEPSLGMVLDAVCRYVVLNGAGSMGESTLDANCIDSTGTWWDTSLNLNECVTNLGGRLAYAEE
jgi:hypothetical protein